MSTTEKNTMKALVLENYNSALKLIPNADRPKPAKGEVLVRIIASGVNPLDLKIKAGLAKHAKRILPAIPGVDMAGIIEEVGEGVTKFKRGDEVYGLSGGLGGIQGSLAEYQAADADLLAIKPANLTMREAAALPLSFITAWEGLADRAHTGKGKTVLIQGGSGGVGHIAVQLAIALGADVYATDRAGKKQLLESYGATAIDFESLTTEDYVNQYTNGEGFDIIFDTIGGASIDHSFTAVKRYGGHVLSILGWSTHNLAPLSFRGATYSGVFTMYPLLSNRGRLHHGDILREATALIESGKLKPLMNPNRYTMETISDAYDAIENKTAKGKIVIDIA